MINRKTQTIQGFLTPTKLLSGIAKSNKSKGQKSPLNNTQPKIDLTNSRFIKNNNNLNNSINQSVLNTSKDNQSYTYNINQTTNNSRLTQGFNSNNNNNFLQKYDQSIQNNNQRKYQSQRYIQTNGLFDRENKKNKKLSIPIIQEDQMINSHRERTLEEIGNKRWHNSNNSNNNISGSIQRQRQRYNQYNNNKRSNNNMLLNKANTLTYSNNNQLSSPLSTYPKSHQSYNGQNSSSIPIKSLSKLHSSHNQQLMTTQCLQLIRKLSSLKQSLQLQINQLQQCLDQTSTHIENMQSQFQKIKLNILTYTSKCLDQAFIQYKVNMVEWQKYQEFQRKILNVVKQLDQEIYNYQEKLEELTKKHNYKEITEIAQEIDKKIAKYNKVVQQVKIIRQQSISMRPTITKDKIQQYQKGVRILCQF